MDGSTPDFHSQLAAETADARAWLQASPLVGDALAGRLTVERYRAFLTEAYHHVRHTLPLLMALGGRLPDRHADLRRDVVHYCEEEVGHELWILDDIRATGGDAEAAARSAPHPATDAMVACAWDTVMRRNPVGFFGMVFVLEGTSVALALQAADRIQASLGLPSTAFRYLRSHGHLDQDHVQHLAGILNRLDDPADREAVRRCARTMYWLYGQVFRGVDAPAFAG
jgi:pyrroloquinoline quinone (PQQ) biosynthesis protein C